VLDRNRWNSASQSVDKADFVINAEDPANQTKQTVIVNDHASKTHSSKKHISVTTPTKQLLRNQSQRPSPNGGIGAREKHLPSLRSSKGDLSVQSKGKGIDQYAKMEEASQSR